MSEQATSGAELRRKARRLVTCPVTGNSYLMRKVSMSVLLTAGTMPENFVSRTLKELGPADDAPTAARQASDNDLALLEKAARTLITAAMLEPRIVERAEADDEVEYEDIPPEDRQYLYKWINNQVPDVPVETIEGEGATVEAVENFPVSGERGTAPVAGTDGEARGDEALATAGTE